MVGELQISNKTHRSIDRRLKFVATSLGHQQRTLMLRCFAISLKDGFFWWIIQNIDTVAAAKLMKSVKGCQKRNTDESSEAAPKKAKTKRRNK